MSRRELEKRVEKCEECDREATHQWGMDLTPLCDEHYADTQRRDDYYAALDAAQETDPE